MALIHSNSPAHRHLPRDAQGRIDTDSPEYKAVVEGVRQRREARAAALRPAPSPAKEPAKRPHPPQSPADVAPVAQGRPAVSGDWETVRGPRMWAELHAWGRREDLLPTTPENRTAWLNLFTGRIPCGKCKRHWAELLQKMPPPLLLLRGESLYAWTVAAHNDVNIRLGKPAWVTDQSTHLQHDRTPGNPAWRDAVEGGSKPL
jgi:hypothetical protein